MREWLQHAIINNNIMLGSDQIVETETFNTLFDGCISIESCISRDAGVMGYESFFNQILSNSA